MAKTGKVIGIGGVFFKSAEQGKLQSWYADNLGIKGDENGSQFMWRDQENPEIQRVTAWSVFAQASKYFDPSEARFMINYIVDDLDAILAKMAASGVRIDPKRENASYGRFAWVFDPDGNKVELWEPAD
jgi:catechol 2,3-dioxygenase-like lactoylglutathione lyase family enzyme